MERFLINHSPNNLRHAFGDLICLNEFNTNMMLLMVNIIVLPYNVSQTNGEL